MNYYIYDGSFPGLLSSIYEAFYSKEKQLKIITEEDFKPGLFSNKIIIKTDIKKSDTVYQAINDKISTYSLRLIYNTFLSEEKNIGFLIYQYLRIGFKIGRKVDSFINNDIVDQVNKLSSKVSKEKHLFLGLLRFKEIQNGIYYAPFEPDYNIISLLAPHFTRRLSDQEWIIHDRKRLLAAIYNKKEWVLTEMNSIDDIEISENESFYQELWQGFYKKIGIEGRRNPRLQRQYMPKRYWKYLIEK